MNPVIVSPVVADSGVREGRRLGGLLGVHVQIVLQAACQLETNEAKCLGCRKLGLEVG